MKYNSVLLNKILHPISKTKDDLIPSDSQAKLSLPRTLINNMAAVTTNNSSPLATPMVTSTRFTDEYDLKEELEKVSINDFIRLN